MMVDEGHEEFERDLIDRVARIEAKVDGVSRYQGAMERRLWPLERFQIRLVAIAATVGALVTLFASPLMNWLLS